MRVQERWRELFASRLFPNWIPDRTRPQTGRLNKSPHTVARVVYSRSLPDRTRPQAGRLNKSPHTVYSFANRSKLNDGGRGGFSPHLSLGSRTRAGKTRPCVGLRGRV